MDNKDLGWLGKFVKKTAFKKEAIDKLPEDELSGQFPPFTDGPGGAPGGDPSQDPSMGAGMPPMPPDPSLDPSMMAPSEPLVWNNNYLVKPIADGPEFIVQLTPSIVNKMPAPMGGVPGAMPPTDPMSDPTLNPNADPNGLSEWMNQQNDGNDKPYSTQEEGTVDPLSREEEGLPIEDTGNENALSNKVNVHKKKASPEDEGFNRPLKTPGADRSNAYMPCAACANYIAADNECSQGLDVEKVQAAKSCSWLNSNFSPFNTGKPGNPDMAHQDKDTVKNDVSEISGGGGAGGTGAKFASKDKNLVDYLKKIWQ
jgi:hypothetical protein